jgi:hypothetical protein
LDANKEENFLLSKIFSRIVVFFSNICASFLGKNVDKERSLLSLLQLHVFQQSP